MIDHSDHLVTFVGMNNRYTCKRTESGEDTHLLAKPEALAGVAVVKLDRHFYFSIRRPEPVRFLVLCGRRRDQSECRGISWTIQGNTR